MHRTVSAVVVASLVVGCGFTKKKGSDAADAAVQPDTVTVSAPAPPAPIATNEESVARYPDEKRVENVAATIQRKTTNVREIPSVGKVVTTLANGVAVTEIAEHDAFALVVFDDPKDLKKRMGWVRQDAFTAAPDVAAKKAPATKGPRCSAPEVAVVGDDQPYCARVCTSDADCSSGQACKGAANRLAKAKSGDAVSVCATFTRVPPPPPPSNGGGRVATGPVTPSATASAAPPAPAPTTEPSDPTSSLPWCPEGRPNPKKAKPGTAPPPPPPTTACRPLPKHGGHDRPNGAPCTYRQDCESQRCVWSADGSGVCSACSTDHQCLPLDTCTGDPKHAAVAAKYNAPLGICIDTSPPDDDNNDNSDNDSSSRNSAPKRDDPPKKKSLGEDCKFNFDCDSGKCGTISDGAGMHKCIKR